MHMNGQCPKCHYHQPKRTTIIVVRVTCPNCHYIQQSRHGPPFANPTELIAWLYRAEELRGRGAEEQGNGEEFTSAPPHLCTSAQNEEVSYAHQICVQT